MQRIGVKGVMCAMRPMAHIRTLQGFSTFWRIERNGAKGIMFLLLLLCPILVGAEGTACFYENGFVCFGAALCCEDLAEAKCCSCPPGPSIYAWSTDMIGEVNTDTVIVYAENKCVAVHSYTEYGYVCASGDCNEQFFSASWYSAGETVRNEPCKERVYADTLMYTFITEEGRRASWVLSKVNISEVDFDPRKLSAYQQVDWLKSHGATLKMDDGKIISSNVTDVDFSSCTPSY